MERHGVGRLGHCVPRFYLLTAMASLAALALTWLLWPVMEHNPFLFFFAVAAVSAWQGGLQPGLFTTALGAVLVYLLLAISIGQWLLSAANLSGLGLF